MSFPFISIPNEILLEIQKKMTFSAFYRLRQTCRQMEKFTERNRFKVKVRYPIESGMLFITVGEESEIGFDFEVLPNLTSFDDCIRTYREKRNNNSYNRITDPFSQISALRFSLILVNYSPNSYTFFESDSFQQFFMPLMQKLRLECELLCFADQNCRRLYPRNLIIQSYVNCVELENYTTLLSSDYRPNKSVTYESLGYLLDMPCNLGAMIGHLQQAVVKRAKGNNNRFVTMLEDFLEEVCIDKNARGNLLAFTIETNQRDELMKPSSLVELWRGKANFTRSGKKQNMTLLKLVIHGGTAILAYFPNYWGTYSVNFEDSYNRNSLYNRLSTKMFFDEFQTPGVYDAFFAAKDDVSAMKALNPLAISNPQPP